MQQIKDQLSWDSFYEDAKNRLHSPSEVKDYNRLIAHSENFFIIAGYGAFIPGYVLIITKEFIPSFGMIDKKNLGELNFLIKKIKAIYEKKFNQSLIVFEHGMCACIGGLDRAHLHCMTIPKNTSKKQIQDSINKTIYDRKIGINNINYNGYELKNIHDINQLFDDKELNLNQKIKNQEKIKIEDKVDIIVNGKILTIDQIKDLPHQKWPHIVYEHINKGGHYVYFSSFEKKVSFLTTKNFTTQFGREVIYNLILKKDKSFQKINSNLNKKFPYLEVWKWQNFNFDENILLTMKKVSDGFIKEKKNSKKFLKYKIEVFN